MRKELPESGESLRDECARRFQQWVRENVPNGARKIVAQQLGASPETVDVWLDGEHPRMPGIKHLLAALAAWGPEFAAHVLAPCGEWTRALSFEVRAERLRREIEELKREVDAVGPSSARMDLVRSVEMALAASSEALAKARALDAEP